MYVFASIRIMPAVIKILQCIQGIKFNSPIVSVIYSEIKENNKNKIIKKIQTENLNFKFNSFNQLDTYIYAYKKSKGKILCFLDSDDFYKKNKVEEIVDFFSNNKNKNIVFDKPVIFYNHNKNYNSNEYNNKKNRNSLWPKFPPQSCISIKKIFFKKMIKEISQKKFELLALDFKIAILSKCIFNDFNIINKLYE